MNTKRHLGGSPILAGLAGAVKGASGYAGFNDSKPEPNIVEKVDGVGSSAAEQLRMPDHQTDTPELSSALDDYRRSTQRRLEEIQAGKRLQAHRETGEDLIGRYVEGEKGSALKLAGFIGSVAIEGVVDRTSRNWKHAKEVVAKKTAAARELAIDTVHRVEQDQATGRIIRNISPETLARVTSNSTPTTAEAIKNTIIVGEEAARRRLTATKEAIAESWQKTRLQGKLGSIASMTTALLSRERSRGRIDDTSVQSEAPAPTEEDLQRAEIAAREKQIGPAPKPTAEDLRRAEVSTSLGHLKHQVQEMLHHHIGDIFEAESDVDAGFALARAELAVGYRIAQERIQPLTADEADLLKAVEDKARRTLAGAYDKRVNSRDVVKFINQSKKGATAGLSNDGGATQRRAA